MSVTLSPPRPWPGLLLRRPAAAALGLGAVSALALPPLHLLPVLWFTVPVLLGLLGQAGGWRRAAWIGACFGFGHQLAGIYWVTHSLFTDLARWFWLVPVAAPGLAVPLALFSVPPALAAWAARPGWPRALAFAGAWTGAELLRGLLFTGFPWNLIGSAWAFHEVPIQAAAIFGVHGLSLVTVLAAALPVAGRAGWLASFGLVAALLGFGAWRVAQPVPAPEPVRLVLVQGNVAQDVKWNEAQRLPIFSRYLGLTREALADAAAAHPDEALVAIWPETASPFLLAQDAQAQRHAADALPAGALLLAGTIRGEWAADGRLRRLFNSLVALTAEGRVAALYDKHHLVPFGEYMPLGGLLPIRMVVGGMDFSSGPGPLLLPLPGLPAVSPLICYEVIFPGRVAPGGERPGWLLNVTNDAWFGFSAGPFQHLAAARLRAVEEGLALVRVAQTGISAVFDARGAMVAHMPLGTTGTVSAALPAPLPQPPFGRLGLWLPALLVLVSLGVALRPRRVAG
jgi:apolipoprotein N-acyltransferase